MAARSGARFSGTNESGPLTASHEELQCARKEALEQQTATAEILRVISASPCEVSPVFRAIVRRATRLCDATLGTVFRFDGELITVAANQDLTPEEIAITSAVYLAPATRGTASGRAIVARPMGWAQNRGRQWVGRGADNVTAAEVSEVEGTATYANGEWSAIFVRDLRSTNSLSFAEGGSAPIAFWDGLDRERGGRALSQWFYVYLELREKPSEVGRVLTAGLGVLFAERLAVWLIRRSSRRARVAATA